MTIRRVLTVGAALAAILGATAGTVGSIALADNGVLHGYSVHLADNGVLHGFNVHPDDNGVLHGY